ncbi:MAG: FAD-binding oxidoreductase, partial [Candidatus Thermoplasmatota archaeon]|nr:FAD-binding oxidoreductase [Candidatus Thermoplasmatota archaeon]
HEILATEILKPVLKPMIISFTDGIYFCQHKTGQIVGGIGNPDEPSGINAYSSFWFLEKMAKTITRYIPVFKNLNVLRQWAGMYDVTPDARPIIGKTKVENFFVACGFSGHGFMVAPVTAKLMSELIVDGNTSIPIDNLSIDRFKKGIIRKEGAVVG